MKILKNKFLLAIILCVTILSGALCFVVPNKKVNANNDYELKIEKVDVKIKEATTETENLITYGDKDYVLDLDGEGNYCFEEIVVLFFT